MRIGITGASGMLGDSLLKNLPNEYKLFACSRSFGRKKNNIQWDYFDLTNLSLLNSWLRKTKPDLVIHCAAIVDVDFCENDIDAAMQLHLRTTEVLADYSYQNNTRLIYISTDSVFDGEKPYPYNEDDKAMPINVYAKTKFLGEKPVKLLDSGLVLRVNIVGFTRKGKSSFSEWLLKSLANNESISLFSDVYFSPLMVDDLSLIINKIIEKRIVGIYHCASNNNISKYDFGKKLAEMFNLSDSNIKKISIDDFDFKARRPKNMALDVNKISSALSINMPTVDDSIRSLKFQYDKTKV